MEVMAGFEPESFDCVVTDPPYGLSREPDTAEVLRHWLAGDDYLHRGGGFMGSSWDSFVPGPAIWREAWRVLRPGGFLLAFGGTRTVDLLAVALRLAGFEIRDQVQWIFGQGFPKSLDVSKAIDDHFGAEREVIGQKHAERYPNGPGGSSFGVGDDPDGTRTAERTVETVPATPEAAAYDGWGTALKPAYEPIVVARKPLTGTVAENVLRHGTGGINVDACRIPTGDALGGGDELSGVKEKPEGWNRPWMTDPEQKAAHAARVRENVARAEALGRWPANVVMSHAEGCELVGVKRVRAITGTAAGRMRPDYQSLVYGGYSKDTGDRVGEPTGYGDEDGMETVEEWRCVPGCPVAELDAQSGPRKGGSPVSGQEPSAPTNGIYGDYGRVAGAGYDDLGGASRFFYQPKVSRLERDAGLGDDFQEGAPPAAIRPRVRECNVCGSRARLPGVEEGPWPSCGHGDWQWVDQILDGFEPGELNWSSGDQSSGTFQSEGTNRLVRNVHPTVKPIDLMRWLVRMVTPPGGRVLDPFLGSGSTLCACAIEGVDAVGVEQRPEFARIAEARVAFWREHGEAGLTAARVAAVSAEAQRAAREAGQLDLFGASS